MRDDDLPGTVQDIDFCGGRDCCDGPCAATNRALRFPQDDEPYRPDWDSYFLGIARAVAQRADCRRRQVGCVLVDTDHRIIGTGYNGSHPGGPSCLAGECPRGLLTYEQVAASTNYDEGPGRCVSTHAEANALLFARTSCKGATAYITDPPCPTCTKLLLSAGVERICYP